MSAHLDDRPAAPSTESAGRDGGWGRVIGLSVALVALLSALVAAFSWPSSELEPRDLPVAVAAPGPAADQLGQQLDGAGLEVTAVADRDAAVAAIEDREAYGAIVAGPGGQELLVASAAGPAVAQSLTQMAQQQGEITVTDVVPTPEADPRGAIFGAGALPLAIGGIMVGALGSLALTRTRDRVVMALVVAVGAGLALAGILQGWLDALGGAYVLNAGVIALGVLAVALPIIGLRHVIGVAGVPIVALIVLLIGNPLSGVTSAPELLPLGWLGQLIPPGATGSALRGTAFFDGAGSLVPVIVLACWAAVGLALTLLPGRERHDVA